MYKPLLCCLLMVGTLAVVQQADPLVLVKTIVLPGVNGRIDHLAVDLQNGRLLVAALGNNTLEVVDLRAGTHARSVKGLHEPQGIALPPDGKIVAVANGAGGDLQLFDRNGFTTVTSTTLGDDPDNVRYEPWRNGCTSATATERWPPWMHRRASGWARSSWPGIRSRSSSKQTVRASTSTCRPRAR